MNRGEIWWVDFGQPFGSEPGFRRPAVVIQADAFNRSAIQTVIVVPMSTNMTLALAPGNVTCRPRDTGLKKSCVANVSQVVVIDRERLVEKAGALATRLREEVEAGLRLVLAL